MTYIPVTSIYREKDTLSGFEALPELIRTIINAAMQIERQNHLGIGPYER